MTTAACAGAAVTNCLAAQAASLAAAPVALLVAATAWPALAECCWHPLPLPVCDRVWAIQFLVLSPVGWASGYVNPPSDLLKLAWMDGCSGYQAGSLIQI